VSASFRKRAAVRRRPSNDKPVGLAKSRRYNIELCTVTFDNQKRCQDTMVLPGKGQIDANWLWTDRPSGFTGAIDGGTGTFAHAKGQCTATPLAGGALRLTARLN
jgi:hypothetical protein